MPSKSVFESLQLIVVEDSAWGEYPFYSRERKRRDLRWLHDTYVCGRCPCLSTC